MSKWAAIATRGAAVAKASADVLEHFGPLARQLRAFASALENNGSADDQPQQTKTKPPVRRRKSVPRPTTGFTEVDRFKADRALRKRGVGLE